MLTEMCNELQQIRQTLQQQLQEQVKIEVEKQLHEHIGTPEDFEGLLDNEEQNKPNNVTDKLTF